MPINSTMTLFIAGGFLAMISLMNIHQTNSINERIIKLETNSLNRIDQIEENIINNCNIYHEEN